MNTQARWCVSTAVTREERKLRKRREGGWEGGREEGRKGEMDGCREGERNGWMEGGCGIMFVVAIWWSSSQLGLFGIKVADGTCKFLHQSCTHLLPAVRLTNDA